LKKKKILIVDDDKDLLKTLTGILETEGYEVNTAETGKEAIDKSKDQFYNLALLDIKLPDIEGTELLKLIDGHLPPTVKVIVTGYPSMENAIRSVNLKADAYIVKPIKAQELLKTIKEKLDEQSEADKMTEDKIAKFIKTRGDQL
jgi:DNA-binding NtrC family response regulator